MRWVSPLLRVGTPGEAEDMGDVYVPDIPSAVEHIRVLKQPVMVPNEEIAKATLVALGYSEDWVNHVLSDWEL